MESQVTGPLDRLRHAYWLDLAAQDALAAIADRDAALSAMAVQARAWGITLEEADLRAALRPDPLGLAALAPHPVTAMAPPGQSWLPAGLVHDGAQWGIDWAHFGGDTLSEPFFEDALRRARNRPITQLLRPCTPLHALLEQENLAAVPPPDGLIFHMSRCGSTLVAQMLGALEGATVISEAPPVDALLQVLSRDRAMPLAIKAVLLRRLVAALTMDRDGKTRRRFVKTDSWHTAALPLFRAAFPATPWVFLYRDPLAVMLSQKRMPGAQTVPGGYSSLLNLDTVGAIAGPDFTARVLAAVCDAAADHAGLGGGLFLPYEALPDAMTATILPHFAITPDAGEMAAIAAASRRDAKLPSATFDPALRDPARGEAEPLQSVVARVLAGPVARVAALAGQEG